MLAFKNVRGGPKVLTVPTPTSCAPTGALLGVRAPAPLGGSEYNITGYQSIAGAAWAGATKAGATKAKASAAATIHVVVQALIRHPRARRRRRAVALAVQALHPAPARSLSA